MLVNKKLILFLKPVKLISHTWTNFFSFFVVLIGLLTPVYPQSVTNVRFNQTEDDQIVVTYDLIDKSSHTCTVKLSLSKDGGKNFTIMPRTVSGDVGDKIKPGRNKRIFWDVLMDLPKLQGNRFVFRVVVKLNVSNLGKQVAKREEGNLDISAKNSSASSNSYYEQFFKDLRVVGSKIYCRCSKCTNLYGPKGHTYHYGWGEF